MKNSNSRRDFIRHVGIAGLTLSSVQSNVDQFNIYSQESNEHLNELKFLNITEGSLRSGIEKVDITPQSSQQLLGYGPRMSQGIRDNIYHKILVLEAGNNQVIIVSSDIVRVSPSTYDEVAEKLEKLCGVKKNNFWWTFTHTHSAPEVGSSGIIPFFSDHANRYKNRTFDQVYAEFVKNSLLNGVVSVLKKLVPARLGLGWGYSRANINRRARDLVEDKIYIGENPDGPIDRKIGLLKIENHKKEPLALISNYPIHGTVLPASDSRISGDVPGVVSEYVEMKIGAPLLFINGAEGNIAPRYSVSTGEKSIEKADRFLGQFRNMLGDNIIEAYNRIDETRSYVKIITDRIIIETPMRENLKGRWPLELKDYTRKSSLGSELIKFPISFLFFNTDIAIWGAPCELFCEISNYIRDNSPFPNTLFFGLTNGSLGYLPTKDEMIVGGYEANTSPFTYNAEYDLTKGVLTYLNRVSKLI